MTFWIKIKYKKDDKLNKNKPEIPSGLIDLTLNKLAKLHSILETSKKQLEGKSYQNFGLIE